MLGRPEVPSSPGPWAMPSTNYTSCEAPKEAYSRIGVMAYACDYTSESEWGSLERATSMLLQETVLLDR